ncbi:unnamed protein product [Paramecium sonneborni]|uniref:ACB domain-containing protein n=1 Tax=Paramecium sonneborni TaxID=65129 RepID=A0A8S1RAY3_9CILI|nr:unnamed protein product [Paramecium sonneborni]
MIFNFFGKVNQKITWIVGITIATIGGSLLFWKRQPKLNQESDLSENSPEFIEAAKKGRTLVGLSQPDQLWLYCLYKQATVGDCNIPEPMRLHLQDHAKWTAWSKCKGMNKADAEKLYIKQVQEYLENGVECDTGSAQNSQFGMKVSTMKNAEHDTNEAFIEKINKTGQTIEQVFELNEKEQQIFQEILDSLHNSDRLIELLKIHNEVKYLKCENEQQIKLIHVVVDDDNIEALKLLIPYYKQHNLINIQESVSGMTALHYGCLSGNKDIVELLLKNGADPKIRDFSGMDCFETIDAENKEWLEQM